MQGQQNERVVFGFGSHQCQLIVVGDYLLDQDQVGLQQRLGRALHRQPGEPAHLAQRLCQRVELVMKSGAHKFTVGVAST